MATSEMNTKTMMGAGVYDVRDLAKLLKCSDKTVRRMIDAGEIPGVRRVRRLVRASRAVVDEWLSATSGS